MSDPKIECDWKYCHTDFKLLCPGKRQKKLSNLYIVMQIINSIVYVPRWFGEKPELKITSTLLLRDEVQVGG